jgi:hypothetical protein
MKVERGLLGKRKEIVGRRIERVIGGEYDQMVLMHV